jgi:hypothetical protein
VSILIDVIDYIHAYILVALLMIQCTCLLVYVTECIVLSSILKYMAVVNKLTTKLISYFYDDSHKHRRKKIVHESKHPCVAMILQDQDGLVRTICKDNDSKPSAPAIVNGPRGTFCTFMNYLNLLKSCDRSGSCEKLYRPQSFMSNQMNNYLWSRSGSTTFLIAY